MNLPKFDEDYYEHGVERGVSGYQNYRYMPTRSYPEAIDIIKNIDFHTCVDFGCAKGFLVHTLRQLGKDAYGEDISDYAIENSIVPNFVSKPTTREIDLLICKDVLEHVPETELKKLLKSFINRADKFFFVIPLGDNDLFRIREYELDVTHVTKKTEDWWIDLFRDVGFKIVSFDYSFGRVKEKWIPVHPYGNGFFILEK